MPAASGQQHRRNAKHEVLCMRWSDIAVRKKLYAVFVVGIGFFISIMVLILSFLYDVGEDAELLGRPRNDTELLTAEVGHLQWAMSVQDYVMNEGRIPLEAALDGRRCVFGTWFYGPNRTALEQEVPDLRPLFAVLDQKHLALQSFHQYLSKQFSSPYYLHYINIKQLMLLNVWIKGWHHF